MPGDGEATYAGEPVEAVVGDGRVHILHARSGRRHHAQRIRDDQATCMPPAPAAHRAWDATAALTVTAASPAAPR